GQSSSPGSPGFASPVASSHVLLTLTARQGPCQKGGEIAGKRVAPGRAVECPFLLGSVSRLWCLAALPCGRRAEKASQAGTPDRWRVEENLPGRPEPCQGHGAEMYGYPWQSAPWGMGQLPIPRLGTDLA